MRSFIAPGALTVLLSTIHLVLSSSSSPSLRHDLSTRAPSGSKNVIVQMFEWNWDSIAAECTNFLGPAGYGFVQASPAQEHIEGPQWYTDYQPVSYQIISKRGDRTQYQNMITTCHKAGVKVIADTIFNHMTANGTGTVGVAGSNFSSVTFSYPGIYTIDDFHDCGLEPNNVIVNYDNRLEVQTCELTGLADIATDTNHPQQVLAAYANDLLSLGVDGLRLDAAKNIAASDLINITSKLKGKPYITQEVIYGAGEPIMPSEYLPIGDVQEFRYTTALFNAFSGSNTTGIGGLENLDSQGWVPGNQANVFVANHDTERGDSSLNLTSPSNTYITATIFSLAHPYGTPTVLSSYAFTTYDQGAPNNGTGECTATGGTGGWNCQHRYPPISGMVGFHNAVGSAALTNWVSPTPQQIAFERDAIGYVAINNMDSAWNTTLSTSLPDGLYCDVISGTNSSGKCTGISVTVSKGSFDASVSPRGAIAIHTNLMGSSTKSAAVTQWKQNALTRYLGSFVVLVVFLQFSL